METTRREFIEDSLASLGFLALPSGLFAAPVGWKPERKPNLVFGILSDTHLMVNRRNGKTLYPTMSLDYIRNAFKYFKEKNIDAFVHLGDASHRGDIREWEFHKEVFEEVFGKNGPPKIVVVGNHELFECDKEWFPDAWQQRMIGANIAGWKIRNSCMNSKPLSWPPMIVVKSCNSLPDRNRIVKAKR
ncbi:MAG: metallophosphoesterase [Ruminococcus sp.]|nr:metallophosphoesterase [Ruminococcus sp.]